MENKRNFINFTISMPIEMNIQLEKVANKARRSKNQQTLLIIEEFLESHPTLEPEQKNKLKAEV